MGEGRPQLFVAAPKRVCFPPEQLWHVERAMHFGIDLGTTNSLISVFEEGQARLISGDDPLLPSVVSEVDKAFIVGHAASSRRVSHPSKTVAAFKRAMGTQKEFRFGRKALSAVDLSAMVLTKLREMAVDEVGHDVKDVVISVPAYFNQLQRDAVRAAALAADLNPLRLINEPTAAAIAYGLQDIEEQGHILVFDLGGGTFDVSIIEVFEGVLEVKATSGDAFLGGEDFTEAICTHFAEAHAIPVDTETKARLWDAAETLKCGLASTPEVSCSFGWGRQTRELSLTRDEFVEIAGPLIRRLRLPVERALYDSRLSREQIDKVVLVGGATRMPLIRNQISRMIGRLPEVGIDPDHVVALGASIQSALTAKDSALDDVVMTDVSAFSLGIEVSQKIGSRIVPGFFDPIIERNTVIPASRERMFSTMQPGQTEVNFKLFQGEAPRVEDNIPLGSLRVSVPMNKTGHEEIAVRLSYDTSGLLEIDTQVLSTGQRRSIVITDLTGGLSAAEISERRETLAKLKFHPKDDEANIALIARIERCYAMALDGDRHRIQDMLLTFEHAIDRQNLSEIAALHRQMSDQLDQFENSYVR